MKPINAINGVITAHALEHVDEFSNLKLDYLGDHGYFFRFSFSFIPSNSLVDVKGLGRFEEGVQAELSRIYKDDYPEIRVLTYTASLSESSIRVEGMVDFYHPQNQMKGEM